MTGKSLEMCEFERGPGKPWGAAEVKIQMDYHLPKTLWRGMEGP